MVTTNSQGKENSYHQCASVSCFDDIARLPLHHYSRLLAHPFSCFFLQGSRDRLCSSLLDAGCSSPSTGKSAAEGLGLTVFLDRFCWKQVSTARARNSTHFLSEISLTIHSAPDGPTFLARSCRMPSVSGCSRRSGCLLQLCCRSRRSATAAH
jgi:hypothetical protein